MTLTPGARRLIANAFADGFSAEKVSFWAGLFLMLCHHFILLLKQVLFKFEDVFQPD